MFRAVEAAESHKRHTVAECAERCSIHVHSDGTAAIIIYHASDQHTSGMHKELM